MPAALKKRPKRKCCRKTPPPLTPERRAELLTDALGSLTGILDAVLEGTKGGGVLPGNRRQEAIRQRNRVLREIAVALGVRPLDLERAMD